VSEAGGRPALSGRYLWYALALLALGNLLNYLDRNIILALFEPIKDELDISDTQLGWLGSSYAIAFALGASLVDNLIQAVNILGSLFYGTILGIFLVAFFLPRAPATRVFVAALASEALVLVVWRATSIGFLWFNVIGCAAVVGLCAFGGGAERRIA